jgi:hypothetical protein
VNGIGGRHVQQSVEHPQARVLSAVARV